MKQWICLAVLACACCSSDTGGSDAVADDFSGPAVCPECEMDLVEIAVLGDPADPASVWEGAGQAPCVVGQMKSGEFLVSAPVGGGEILVYEAEGPSTRSIGHPGEGPGEFGSQLRLIVGPGDTIYVLDEDFPRLQILSPSGAYVRSFTFPWRVSTFALLSTGEIVIHPAPRPGPSNALPLFYLYSRSGEEIRSFGEPDKVLTDLDQWAVSPAPGGGFWESNTRRYEARLRKTDGTVTRTIRRTVDWFPPDAELEPGFPMTGPLPTILHHVTEDGAGLLWVYLLRTDDDWEPPSSPEINPGSTRQIFDTVIEVLDLQKSRLVTTLQLDEWLGSACGSNLAYTVFYTEEGDTRVRVLEPRLLGY